jgi:anti-sigma factor RsiW
MRFARDHRWAPSHMSAYLDGELAPRGRARMERHTAECEECLGTLDGLRRMLGMLSRLSPPGESAKGPEIAAAVRRRLHEPPGR